jgi:hypothetical protein
LTSCFPGMLLWCFLSDSEIVTIAPVFTGITFIFYIQLGLCFSYKVFIF